VKATLILFGGPCAGNYEIESQWPPAEKIRAVHDGNGYRAVLDLATDEPQPGEQVVEYEISSWGYMCGRGSNAPRGAHAVYFRAGLAEPARLRAAGIAASPLEAVG
jgi:hypothetical protein